MLHLHPEIFGKIHCQIIKSQRALLLGQVHLGYLGTSKMNNDNIKGGLGKDPETFQRFRVLKEKVV